MITAIAIWLVLLGSGFVGIAYTTDPESRCTQREARWCMGFGCVSFISAIYLLVTP